MVRQMKKIDRPLRILHVVRAPVGGIIRHVLDLAIGQVKLGHQVGIIADSLTGGERADTRFAELEPLLELGIHRLPIHRAPQMADLITWRHIRSLTRRLAPDVLHGHGAKAGAFVRLHPKALGGLRIYTPHGGSLHFPRTSSQGRLYASIERFMMNRTELFLFESGFAQQIYEQAIGRPKGLVNLVFNGVTAAEFDPIISDIDATDLVYVGEFRHIKGADLLVDAFAKLRQRGHRLTLTLAGDGEEMQDIEAQVARLGLQDSIRFVGHVPARTGFAKGRLLVVPSRGDSMPYVVIEAGAAGQPMIAANTGGIPEIFGEFRDALFTANDVDAMADAIAAAVADHYLVKRRAQDLRARIQERFSQKAMVDGVMAGYRDAYARQGVSITSSWQDEAPAEQPVSRQAIMAH